MSLVPMKLVRTSAGPRSKFLIAINRTGVLQLITLYAQNSIMNSKVVYCALLFEKFCYRVKDDSLPFAVLERIFSHEETVIKEMGSEYLS